VPVRPTWVVQMPSLVAPDELSELQRRVGGATGYRMLREMADALETLTADRTLVLVFEDLHWSDRSTVDLVGYLARRREPARLVVIGTYRAADLVITDHPLNRVKRELHALRASCTGVFRRHAAPACTG
jgi:predicted ATPase